MKLEKKIILAILIPIIFFLCTMLIGTTFRHGPFGFEEPEAILLWLFYVFIIGFLEIKLFTNNNTDDKLK